MVSENSGLEANKPFVRSFSEEEEILLMEEYLQFVEKHGNNVRNKWVEFLKNSSLNGKFGPRQIGKKMGNLERKFEKRLASPSSSPPRHPHQARLFHLSQSLWGRRDGKPPLVDDDGDDNKLHMIKPASSSAAEMIIKKKKKRTHEDDDWEKDLLSVELELHRQKLDLEMKACQLRLKRLKGPLYNFRTPSSEKKEDRKKVLRSSIDSPIEPLALDFGINDNNSDEGSDRSTKSKDGKQTSLESVEPHIDGGISSKDDINGELGIEADDMQSIDCVEESPQQYLKDVDVESNVKTVTLPSGVVIEDIVVGDTTKRLAKKGRMVKVHTTGKVKGSDRYFESARDLTVRLGNEQMIDGFSEGVEGMHVGGERRLIIPPSMGFGDEGLGEDVPPNSWLEYKVELVSVLRSQKKSSAGA